MITRKRSFEGLMMNCYRILWTLESRMW